ncbi:MAG: hypothetical protein AAFN70_18105, partial [Planctomycetota bacterium]
REFNCYATFCMRGLEGGVVSLFPKLETRIRRLDRQWDGEPLFALAKSQAGGETSIGSAEDICRDDPRLADLNANVLEIFSDPGTLMVTVPALVLYADEDREILDHVVDPQHVAAVRSLWKATGGLQPAERFGLLDAVCAVLREHKPPHIVVILEQINSLSGESDWQLRCWVRLMKSAIQGPPALPRKHRLGAKALMAELIELVSIASTVGENSRLVEYRFQTGWGQTGLPPMSALPEHLMAWPDLERTIEKVGGMPTAARLQIVQACSAALAAGGNLCPVHASMIRWISLSLGHPVVDGISPGRAPKIHVGNA